MKTAAADKLAQHIAAMVAAWPPPEPEQVSRVAILLRGAARGGDAS